MLFNYVLKFPCGTYPKSNWKWKPQYTDFDIQNRT